MKIQKLAVLIASGVLVLCVCGVGMTYALLKHVTDEKVNEFAPGTVSQDIVENSDPTPDSSNTIPYDEDGAVKQVEIKNTGDVDTYVRVMLIPGWKANGTAAAAGSYPGSVRGGSARGTGGGRRFRRRAGEQYSAMPLYTDMDRTGRHSVAELRGRPVAGSAPSFRFLAHPSRLLSPVGRLRPQRIGRRRVFE